MQVVGGPTTDAGEHDAHLREVLASEPDLVLDNGGDLFVRYLEAPYSHLLGGTEETTSGRMRLVPLREQIARPVLVINDSPIKQFAENHHAVGQSVLESFLRITNRMTNGRRVVVFGYGSCGKGVAVNFRNAFASVSVVDPDPLKRLEACLDGFSVPERAEALGGADVVITVTGARDVLTASDLPLLRDGVILANAGHFPTEIAAGEIESAPKRDWSHGGGGGDRNAHLGRRSQHPSSRRRPHGQLERPAAARELDRVDGSGLRSPGALPAGDSSWQAERVRRCRPRTAVDRRECGRCLPGEPRQLTRRVGRGRGRNRARFDGLYSRRARRLSRGTGCPGPGVSSPQSVRS